MKDDGLYMGINIPEVERQKASKALNCDRQCPLWVKSRHVQRKSPCPLCAKSGLVRRSKEGRLFHHLVGATLHRLWHGNAERLGGL